MLITQFVVSFYRQTVMLVATQFKNKLNTPPSTPAASADKDHIDTKKNEVYGMNLQVAVETTATVDHAAQIDTKRNEVYGINTQAADDGGDNPGTSSGPQRDDSMYEQV